MENLQIVFVRRKSWIRIQDFFFSKLDFSVATLRLKKYSQEKNKSHWQIENRLLFLEM